MYDTGGAGNWPDLSSRFGYRVARANNAAGGPGVGGTGGPSAYPGAIVRYPQLGWVTGNIYVGYNLRIPLKFDSVLGEYIAPSDELFIASAVLKWENLAPGAAGFDTGFFVTTLGGATFGSIPVNQTGGVVANARLFGIGRQQVTGAFGFWGVVGLAATFTPLTHPAGDVRYPILVEYRIWNAKNGRGARLEVWINGQLQLSSAFSAGNALGIPSGYVLGAGQSTFTPIASVETGQKLWFGQYTQSSGPDESASL